MKHHTYKLYAHDQPILINTTQVVYPLSVVLTSHGITHCVVECSQETKASWTFVNFYV